MQSVPKDTVSSGGGSTNNFTLTNGKPVGAVKTPRRRESNQLQSGSYAIHTYTAQTLDNGCIRFTIEYTAPQGLRAAVFNPPEGDWFKLFGARTSGSREIQTFDLTAEEVRSVKLINIGFSASDKHRFFVIISTADL